MNKILIYTKLIMHLAATIIVDYYYLNASKHIYMELLKPLT